MLEFPATYLRDVSRAPHRPRSAWAPVLIGVIVCGLLVAPPARCIPLLRPALREIAVPRPSIATPAPRVATSRSPVAWG